MSAPLSLEDLTKLVEKGETNTVVMAQIDMQGRVMGKSFHALHFLEDGVEETHSCLHMLTAVKFKSVKFATQS